ncbi:hypothetical protein IQ243_05265 [Nostocales cyanobacterium LEGE 11386]|nr:hypothetical protein [Nostocales cyanobacterium LEGE 11386]
MTNKPQKPINLSVHESSDPRVISPNSDQAVSADINDLNDSVHDHENVDVPTPEPFDTDSNQNLVDKQITIANLSAS